MPRENKCNYIKNRPSICMALPNNTITDQSSSFPPSENIPRNFIIPHICYQWVHTYILKDVMDFRFSPSFKVLHLKSKKCQPFYPILDTTFCCRSYTGTTLFDYVHLIIYIQPTSCDQDFLVNFVDIRFL